MNHAHQEIDKLKSHLDQCLINQADYERRLSLIEKQNFALKAYAEDLEDHILLLDIAMHKKNLIISGLTEEQKKLQIRFRCLSKTSCSRM